MLLGDIRDAGSENIVPFLPSCWLPRQTHMKGFHGVVHFDGVGVQTRRSSELIQEGFLEEEVLSWTLKKEANESRSGKRVLQAGAQCK